MRSKYGREPEGVVVVTSVHIEEGEGLYGYGALGVQRQAADGLAAPKAAPDC